MFEGDFPVGDLGDEGWAGLGDVFVFALDVDGGVFVGCGGCEGGGELGDGVAVEFDGEVEVGDGGDLGDVEGDGAAATSADATLAA